MSSVPMRRAGQSISASTRPKQPFYWRQWKRWWSRTRTSCFPHLTSSTAISILTIGLSRMADHGRYRLSVCGLWDTRDRPCNPWTLRICRCVWHPRTPPAVHNERIDCRRRHPCHLPRVLGSVHETEMIVRYAALGLERAQLRACRFLTFESRNQARQSGFTSVQHAPAARARPIGSAHIFVTSAHRFQQMVGPCFVYRIRPTTNVSSCAYDANQSPAAA